MKTLADASLSEVERRVLDRLVGFLRTEFGGGLHAVWLYGSRARGEPPHPESDIDLLVIAEGEPEYASRRIWDLVYAAAEAEGASPAWYSARVYTPERLAQRREIRSFFVQEVDRDKIVLAGEP